MLANPLAKFARPRVRVTTLVRSAYERRVVCVVSADVAAHVRECGGNYRCNGSGHTHFTRSRITPLVFAGEMEYVDKHTNVAVYTPQAAGTWQKQRSGPVATMQLRVGRKGRYVPATQMEPAAEMAPCYA